MANAIIVLNETQVETLLDIVNDHLAGVKSGDIVYGNHDAQLEQVEYLEEIIGALRAVDRGGATKPEL